MKASEISAIINATQSRLSDADIEIVRLLTDSRSFTDAQGCLFFAIKTKRNDGVRYVKELYNKGIRNFVVSSDTEETTLDDIISLSNANVWCARDVVNALQLVATARRQLFNIPVVGITGSNGKTIVKDWITQLLQDDHKIVCSPKSYNSQIGVPLSVWQMEKGDDLAIFEAGISETGEMAPLRDIIQPTIGIFTNIGQAHDENFLTRSQKIEEKLQLFTQCSILIYCADHKEIHSHICSSESLRNIARFTWGESSDNSVVLLERKVLEEQTILSFRYQGSEYEFGIPFIDRASSENAMHCIALMLYLGYSPEIIATRCSQLTPVAMRMEMNEAINNSLLVNDGYSLDINSLTIALDFVQHERRHSNKTLVMSDFMQSGMVEHDLYSLVSTLIRQRGISKFIGIGPSLSRNRSCFDQQEVEDFHAEFFDSTEDFIRNYPFSNFQNETILLKGARVFRFENIAKLLQRKSHETIMEVNLSALVRNLNFYRSLIRPSTKLMAMVKASSYGAGKWEIANALQFNHADYLTVAYCDEGVDLRRNGITLPIMVMNPEEDSFDDIIKYNLEPDIYSFRTLQLFNETARLFYSDRKEQVAVHIEFDTGMHRLGFSGKDIAKLAELLNSADCALSVKSIFSHLACSEDPTMDDFTRGQISWFKDWSSSLKSLLNNGDQVMCHILNSSGITRFPEAQMDMVRLGIGLYGISPEPEVQRQLTSVSRIRTRISQLKEIPTGESVGYNRRWIAQRDSRIAIIPIGYADGLSRRLGYGRGQMMIAGKKVPIIGSICMDMCFVDVTGINCNEGDEVLIFADAQLLQEMSDAAETIPYEILTSVSPRVKRVYYQE